MPQVTRKPHGGKPAKPRSDFPLFPHARGYWAKKVRGRLIYFGKVSGDADGEVALKKWLAEKDFHIAGLPTGKHGSIYGPRLCNEFLASKQNHVDSGEITQRTFNDYHATCERIVDQFGKPRSVETLTPTDFEKLRPSLGKTWGPVAVGNEVNRIRVVFRYAFESGFIDKPVRDGPNFKRPSRRIILCARDERGRKDFDAKELRNISTRLPCRCGP